MIHSPNEAADRLADDPTTSGEWRISGLKTSRNTTGELAGSIDLHVKTMFQVRRAQVKGFFSLRIGSIRSVDRSFSKPSHVCENLFDT